MSLQIRLLPEARVDFNQATDWYDDQDVGLGARFVKQIREVLDRIAADPARHTSVYLDIRKAVVTRFP